MPVAVAVLALVLQAFMTGSEDQRRLERRTSALSAANLGLERMTRELRQANWIHFSSSQVLDAEAMVRASATGQAVPRHVRYDCSTGTCWRHEGPPVAFPPPRDAVFDRSTVLVGPSPTESDRGYGRVLGHDVFVPKRVDRATGATVVDYLQPDLLHIRLRLAVKGIAKPLEFADGISLRNTTKFAR